MSERKLALLAVVAPRVRGSVGRAWISGVGDAFVSVGRDLSDINHGVASIPERDKAGCRARGPIISRPGILLDGHRVLAISLETVTLFDGDWEIDAMTLALNNDFVSVAEETTPAAMGVVD